MASKKSQKKAPTKAGPAPKNAKAAPTATSSKAAPQRKVSAPRGANPQAAKGKPPARAPEKQRTNPQADLGTPEKAKRPKNAPTKAELAARTAVTARAKGTAAPAKKTAPAKKAAQAKAAQAKTAPAKTALAKGKVVAENASGKLGARPTAGAQKRTAASPKPKLAAPEQRKQPTGPKGRARGSKLHSASASEEKRPANFDRDDELVAAEEQPPRTAAVNKSARKPAKNVVALPVRSATVKGKGRGIDKAAELEPPQAAGSAGGAQGLEQSGIVAGDPAPSFMLQDESGTVVSSETLRGSPYVLYFYPKDDTPGCTLEACGFRDSLPRFSAKGVRVLGVSPDLPDVHARFKKKYDLTFPLLSDPEKTLAKAYGVWVKKQNYGREYMGVERSTFFVDKHGKVSKVWRGVKVPGHVDLVLDAV